MLPTRKIGKLLLGKATPAQIFLACVLGAMTGFIPSLATSWGLALALTVCIIILNANFYLAILLGGFCKLFSLAAMPLSHAIGKGLLDGPLGGMFKPLINAPILAFFGLEYYVTTGGLVVGLVVGLILGYVIVRGVNAIRTKLVDLDENSEKFKQWSEKKWVKLLTWLLFGGKLEGMSDRFEKKGKVIRPIGVVFAVLLVALVGIGLLLLDDKIVRNELASQLESLNGATVDVESASLSFSEGRMTIKGLQVSDPNNLEMNRFQADELTIELSTRDLLRGRLVLNEITSDSAKTGAKRTTPARKLTEKHKLDNKAPEEETEGYGVLDEYIQDPEKAYAKLEQLKEWLKKAEDMMASDPDGAAKEAEGEDTASMLSRWFNVGWYSQQKAHQLIEGSPDFLIRKLVLNGIDGLVDQEQVNITAKNFSTHPNLVDAPPSFEFTTSKNTFHIAMSLDDLKDKATPGHVKVAYNGLTVDDVIGQVKTGGDKPLLEEGSVEATIDGEIKTVGGTWINLPLNVTLKQTYLNIPSVGRSPNPVDLPVVIHLKGPIDRPEILFDHEAFLAALQKAGLEDMAQAYTQKYQKQLEETVATKQKEAEAKIAAKQKEIEDKVTAKTDEAKKKIDDKVTKKTDEATKKLENKLDDKLKDKLPGGLGGLLGGDKSKTEDDAAKKTDETEKKEDPAKKAIDDALKGLFDRK